MQNCHLLSLGFDCCSFAGSGGLLNCLRPLCSRTSTAAFTSAAVTAAVATVAAPDALGVGRCAGDAVARIGVERSFLLFTHASRRNFSLALLFSLDWLPCFGWDLSVTVAAVEDAAPHENWILSTPRLLWIETLAQPIVATCSQYRTENTASRRAQVR